MLKVLRIKNYALMEDLTIEFEEGLTVITGETGAGKSMVVEAIAVLCGERIEDLSIRSGADYVEITGIFDPTPSVKELLRKSGLEAGDELVIRRRSERGKKQLSYVNDQIVSLNLLKDLTKKAIDLVGQHENQSLFFPHNHLLLLDTYAGLDSQRASCRSQYLEYRQLQDRLRQLFETTKQKNERLDFLKYEIDEIEKNNLQAGEEETLVSEKNLLSSSEKRSALAMSIITGIYEADNNIYSNLSKIKKSLDELCLIDTGLNELNRKLETLITMADDIYRELTDYRGRIDFSQERLDHVMARLDAINRLKKKYGKTVDEIRSYLLDAKKELLQIQTSDEEIQKLQEKNMELEKRLLEQVQILSQKRKTAAKSLEKKILDVLNKLGMEKAEFSLKFSDKEISEDGIDAAEFYISTNPGEDLKPLRKVGSGGEISRITLGLKTILSEADGIPTVIFDEVDTGIGGRIAEAIGELLLKVSQRHQIICITHLPQISVFADNHYLVQKEIKARTTTASVVKLNNEMRKLEVARMLGGKEITKKTVEHAAEILQKRQSR